MAIITNPSILPSGTVGVPYSVTFIIDKQGNLSYPYVLQLQTAGTMPTGLESALRGAKTAGQDASGIGAPSRGATIVGDTSGAQGVYLFGDGSVLQYRPLNSIGFQLGENMSSVFDGGVLGVVDMATVNSSLTYGGRLILPPTLVPASLFDDINWTVSGTPTVAGVYNFGIRMFDGDTNLLSTKNFQITINAPAPPKAKKKRGAAAGVASDTLCFNRDYIERFYPGSCSDGGVILYSVYRIPYAFSHVNARGQCCFKRR